MSIFRPKSSNIRNPKWAGNRTEAFIIARLLDNGYTVLLPYGDNSRYDVVIEDVNGKFWRIQCKTGRYRNGSIEFHTISNNGFMWSKGNTIGKSYKGQIDYFAVYSPDMGKAYLISVEEVGDSLASLRVEPPKNNQEKHVRWAKDYEL